MPKTKITMPSSGTGQQKQKVVPITKIENTWRLGKDFPLDNERCQGYYEGIEKSGVKKILNYVIETGAIKQKIY